MTNASTRCVHIPPGLLAPSPATAQSPRELSPAAAESPRQPSSALSAAAASPCELSLAAVADDESDYEVMECFVSAIVDDHVSAMLSSGISVALGKSELRGLLQLKLRVAMWDMTRQLRIALLPDRAQ